MPFEIFFDFVKGSTNGLVTFPDSVKQSLWIIQSIDWRVLKADVWFWKMRDCWEWRFSVNGKNCEPSLT